MVSLMLVLALLAGFALPSGPDGRTGSQAKALSFEQTASSAAPSAPSAGSNEAESQAPDYANTDLVGYPSYWTGLPTIGAGYATSGIAANASAMSYRDSLTKSRSRPV